MLEFFRMIDDYFSDGNASRDAEEFAKQNGGRVENIYNQQLTEGDEIIVVRMSTPILTTVVSHDRQNNTFRYKLNSDPINQFLGSTAEIDSVYVYKFIRST
jgi:ASC-1-like (ASCH) protein